MYSRRSAQGFALLEILVTIVLMAIALLGTAAMQVYGIKVTQGAQFRAQAVVLATDLMERVEANNVGAVAGSYVAASLPATSSSLDCTANRCTPADMAQYDLVAFAQGVAQQLPSASATVSRSGAGPYVYTVTLTWQERSFRASRSQSASAATVETFSYTVSRTIYDRAAII
jgi:type IV pilus assembly protein PilV